MRSREVIKRLEAHGWVKVRQRGSPVQFRHPERRALVTVPHPKQDIPIGTLKSIERASGIRFP